jgi:hypothetical protein
LAVQDPQEMAQGVMAIQQQAAAWIASYREALATGGLGFTDDDLRAIADSAAAHPLPPGTAPGAAPSAEDLAAAERVREQAMNAHYPPGGFPPDDPRLAPAGGVSLVAYAVAARAIGWSTDEAFRDRVVRALGLEPGMWLGAVDEWTRRITDDVVLATFYGQLFSQADPLPRRPT